MKCRERQSQETGGDLRKASLMALAVRLGSEHERHATVRNQLDLDDMGCRGKRGVDRRFVAALEPVRQIARRFVPEKRRLGGERLPRIATAGNGR